MPTDHPNILVVPNRVEVSNFGEGFMPDSPPASVPIGNPDPGAIRTWPAGLLAASNLVPDRFTDTLMARDGFTQISGGTPGETYDGYSGRQLFFFEAIVSGVRKKFLIMIAVTATDNVANNGKFLVYDLTGNTWNTYKSFTLPHVGFEHWGQAIQNKWYGGSAGIPMYSWDPNTTTFNSDAADMTGFKTWVDNVNDAITMSTQRGRDFAFKIGDRVQYNPGSGTKFYAVMRDCRFDKWDSDNVYRRGDKVSRWATWAAVTAYWKSFECILQHDPTAVGATSYPGTGATWKTYWKKVRLPAPVDPDDTADGDVVSPGWGEIVPPSKAIIGTFYGERLWLRAHDEDNWSILQYSAPLKPEKDKVIADVVFDPTNFTPANDIDGNGGGWLFVRSGDGDAIRALMPFGNYLIIFKRWKTFVLAGTDETTWTLRPLDYTRGTMGPRSVATHSDGLVYFLDMDGKLCRTDGTSAEDAPGADKVRLYIRAKLDNMLLTEVTQNWYPTVHSHRGYIYITLCKSDGTLPVTLVYDPQRGSFFPTDYPMLDIATGRVSESERLWFTPAVPPAAAYEPSVYYLTPGTYTDPTDLDPVTSTTKTIPWSMQAPWMSFGSTHNDRRIRRTFALIETALDVSIAQYRNYGTSATVTTARTASGTTGHYEGAWIPDSKSVSVALAGVAPAKVYGIGVDTEPRRTRYHRGSIA